MFRRRFMGESALGDFDDMIAVPDADNEYLGVDIFAAWYSALRDSR
jgi:hypothetical protein